MTYVYHSYCNGWHHLLHLNTHLGRRNLQTKHLQTKSMFVHRLVNGRHQSTLLYAPHMTSYLTTSEFVLCTQIGMRSSMVVSYACTTSQPAVEARGRGNKPRLSPQLVTHSSSLIAAWSTKSCPPLLTGIFPGLLLYCCFQHDNLSSYTRSLL